MDFIDQNVLQFFAQNRTEWLSFVMLSITYSGGYLVVSTVATLSAISFFIHKHTKRILPLFISVGGTALSVFTLKNIFDKARPSSEAFYLENSFSFPSGHAALAMALYGFLFLIIYKHDKHHLKNKTLILLGFLILLVGVSRLYLGVHYLSDVLAGYVVGFIWLLISAAISKSKISLLPDSGHP